MIFYLTFFCEKHLPSRQIKYKVINYAPSYKSFMANKLPSTNLERFLRRIKSPLRKYYREIYRALIVPNWPK